MLKPIFVLSGLMLFAPPLQQPGTAPAQAPGVPASAPAVPAPAPAAAPAPAQSGTPPDAAHLVNPVKPTPESQAHAKKMYGYDCAVCHGAAGDGKGDIAGDMKPPLKDYTNPEALKDISDGEMFYIIKNGKGQMPSEGERAKPEDVWNMVILVRSFSKK